MRWKKLDFMKILLKIRKKKKKSLPHSMTDYYSSIRHHLHSGLDNQKQIAQLLIAIEETIHEQKETKNPLTYFSALVSLLQQQLQTDSDSDIASNAIYLLAIILPRYASS